MTDDKPQMDALDLRDYFAAHAMQALIAVNPPKDMDDDLEIANNAYSMAYAMLKARAE